MNYKVGDLVRVYSPQTRIGLKLKLRSDLYRGSVEVTRVGNHSNVEIRTNKGLKWVHTDRVKHAEQLRTDPIQESQRNIHIQRGLPNSKATDRTRNLPDIPRPNHNHTKTNEERTEAQTSAPTTRGGRKSVKPQRYGIDEHALLNWFE